MSSLAFIAFRHLRARHSFNFISFISYLSIIGLGIGVAVLILTLSILTGFEHEIERKIISFDGHIRLRGFLDTPVSESNPTVDSILSSMPEILDRARYVNQPAVVRYKSEMEGVFVEGISMEKAGSVFGTPDLLTAGEFDFGLDKTGLLGTVLGRSLAEKLSASVDSRVILLDPKAIGVLGKTPRIGQFRIAGIYDTGLQEYDESVVYVGLAAAQRLFGYKNQITGEILKLASAGIADDVADKLDRLLEYPYIPTTWKDRHQNLFSWLSVQKYPITIIFALIALVAIVNITSSLTMIVMEKTKDIGVLRTVGCSRRGIAKLFFMEGAIIGLLGVMLGTGLALLLGSVQMTYGILKIPEDVYFMKTLPVLFEFLHFVVVGVVGFFLAVGATLYPAWKASGISPAQAVRYE